MRLTDKEIDMILEKIKRKYEEYAKKYGKEFFSYKAFRERYYVFLRSKGDIQVFLYAEIQALEDRVKEIEEKIRKKKVQEEISNYFKSKEEEILSKIANYPELEGITDRARHEIKKLSGTIKVIYHLLEEYFYLVKKEFQDEYRKCLNVFKDFVIKPFSGFFSDYINKISNPFFKEYSVIEKMEQTLIKEWGIALNDIFFFLKNSDIANDEVNEFLDILDRIIKDFRLTIFVRNR